MPKQYLAIWFCICSVGLFAQSRLLPNPDGYPADSLLVILREDTTTNQLRAWLVNRTRDTIKVNRHYGYIRNWLKVRDEYGEWQCYDCIPRFVCGTGLRQVTFFLAPNEFTKAFEKVDGERNFATEARAFFIVNDTIRYSAAIPVKVDHDDINSPERLMLKQMLSGSGTDSSRLSIAYQYYGRMTRSAKKYRESREAYIKSIAFNPNNYQAKYELVELKYIEITNSKTSDSLTKVTALRTMFQEWEKEIPATEKDLWQKILKRRKIYAKLLH